MASELKFELVEVQPGDDWDREVEASPEGTVFSLSDYLNCSGKPFRLFKVLRGRESKAAVVQNFNAAGEATIIDYIIHNGIFFTPRGDMKRNRIITEDFEIMEFVIDALAKRHKGIAMSLSPEVKDIRPFLWYNYHSDSPRLKFQVYVYYTTYVDISRILDADDVETVTFKDLGYSRRQEIRYGLKASCRAYESPDIERFVDLYASAMGRVDAQSAPSAEMLKTMALTMSTFIKRNAGTLFLINNSKDILAAGAFFVRDSKRAYYLYGANDPILQERYTGSKILWDAFKVLNQQGVAEIDMEGVNSPKRGWFKLSFGGDLRPYYYVALAPDGVGPS